MTDWQSMDVLLLTMEFFIIASGIDLWIPWCCFEITTTAP